MPFILRLDTPTFPNTVISKNIFLKILLILNNKIITFEY